MAETIGVPAGQLDFDAMPSKAELTDLQTQIRALLADPVQMQSAGYTPQSLNYQLAMWEQRLHGGRQNPEEAAQLSQVIYTTPKGRQIRPKSYGQYAYLQAIDKYDITFGIGRHWQNLFGGG